MYSTFRLVDRQSYCHVTSPRLPLRRNAEARVLTGLHSRAPWRAIQVGIYVPTKLAGDEVGIRRAVLTQGELGPHQPWLTPFLRNRVSDVNIRQVAVAKQLYNCTHLRPKLQSHLVYSSETILLLSGGWGTQRTPWLTGLQQQLVENVMSSHKIMGVKFLLKNGLPRMGTNAY